MRWRLITFVLSATAVFCFMLLTAVTDYGQTDDHQPAMISASRVGTASAEALASLSAGVAAKAPAAVALSAPHFEREYRPNPIRLFVADNADPVMARHEDELEEKVNRGKPSRRNRLKWDENGWYREEVALVTAYCPCSKCCGHHSPGITSIGKNAWTPGLATDPVNLDYGTRVFVPGYGHSVVDDTGGAMRRHWRRDGVLHIDVRMTYHHEARSWGKQYLRVKIYDEE
jgi:3D (Asp-Asp-Asp) domain-containing protein